MLPSLAAIAGPSSNLFCRAQAGWGVGAEPKLVEEDIAANLVY
jgi:hypothetical protein